MIPLATDSITVTRVVETDVDPYDTPQPPPTTIATAVRAVISTPAANTALSGGDKVVYTAEVRCDPCSIQAADTVTDKSGTAWVVLWAREINALGFDFILAQLRLVQGEAT